jgi:hypothetical protein
LILVVGYLGEGEMWISRDLEAFWEFDNGRVIKLRVAMGVRLKGKKGDDIEVKAGVNKEGYG